MSDGARWRAANSAKKYNPTPKSGCNNATPCPETLVF